MIATGNAAQLMLGIDELEALGPDGVFRQLEKVARALPFERLLLWAEDPGDPLVRLVTAKVHSMGASVDLWTMVLADAGRQDLPSAQTWDGQEGRGGFGAWDGFGDNPDEFLFYCPTAVLADEEGPQQAVEAACKAGAQGLFLDRIRFAGPANGLAFLGACSCPECRDRYYALSRTELPDLSALAIEHAHGGRAGATAFLAKAEPVLHYRATTIGSIVDSYARAARGAGLELGLDLFAPSLGPLVGVDWAMLAPKADFIKAMLYVKTRGPACLPLEFGCFAQGLIASGVARRGAIDFTATLLGVSPESVSATLEACLLPAALSRSEYERAKLLMQDSPLTALYAGIELVEYEGGGVGKEGRDDYLSAYSNGQTLTAPIALCWNVLQVPDEHLDALACLSPVPGLA